MDDGNAWKRDESEAWLEHVRNLWTLKREARDALDAVYHMAAPRGIDYTRPNVESTGDTDTIVGMIEAMEELSSKWRDRIAELEHEWAEANAIVDKVEDPWCRQLIRYYYVTGGEARRTWEQVAKMMGYEEPSIYPIRRKALLMIHRHLPSEWRTDVPDAQI